MSSINSRVPPLRLMAVDTPSDGQLPSYQSSSGEFEWVDDSSAAPGGSDGQFQINNSGAFGGSILSTNKTTSVTLNSGGSGDPSLEITSSTKAITLKVDTNQKLKVQGGVNSFVFDASSASGGITFPDGTTQTTAASGGGGFPTLSIDDDDAPDDYNIAAFTPYGIQGTSAQSLGVSNPFFYPFVSPKSGDLARMTVSVRVAATGENVLVGVYSEDTNGYFPDTLLGSATFSLNSTGEISQTSFTSTITLTAGTKYWIGWVPDTASSSGQLWAQSNSNPAFGGATDSLTGARPGFRHLSSANALPSSISSVSDLYLDTGKRACVGMKW